VFFLQTNGSGVLSFAGVSASAGQVIQVVTATDSTSRSTTSTSFVTASNTLSVSITPSSASNKVFVIVSSTFCNTSGDGFVYATIYRGATNLAAGNGMAIINSAPGITAIEAPLCMTILDSPNTTSATTYQVYFRSNNGAYTANLNTDQAKGSITVMEIKG